MHKLKIDTKNHVAELDGRPLNGVTEATIVIMGGETPKVTLAMEADVEFCGDIDVKAARPTKQIDGGKEK